MCIFNKSSNEQTLGNHINFHKLNLLTYIAYTVDEQTLSNHIKFQKLNLLIYIDYTVTEIITHSNLLLFRTCKFFISLSIFLFLQPPKPPQKWYAGEPPCKPHFSHVSLEKHPSPRLIMNKNKKQVDILILIYSDFTLIFFFSPFSSRREDEFKAAQERRGEEDKPPHYPLLLYNLISISFSLSFCL